MTSTTPPTTPSTTPSTLTAARRRPPTLSDRLDREWAAMRTRPAVLARVRSWDLVDPPVVDLDELLALTGYRREPAGADNDMLRRLVEIARTDDVAARVVLQRLLPGLLAAVRRRRGPHGTAGLLEELIGCAWVAIRTYRTDRRPQRVAGNLVHDAIYQAFIAPRRRLAFHDVVSDPRTFDRQPAGAPAAAFEELMVVLSEARRAGLPDADLELVRALLRSGSTTVVAAERHVTARTVRNHRDRVTARIRRLAA